MITLKGRISELAIATILSPYSYLITEHRTKTNNI